MATINFQTKPFKIHSRAILLLPKSASAKLPSRGMTLVKGTINGQHFKTPLEPDGRGSHWLEINKTLIPGAGAEAGDVVSVAIEPTKEWPEPSLPADLKKALAADPTSKTIWDDITPMARWDWLRWINSTGRSETRERRISVALSKLKAGTRRPCCFNRSLCTDPAVSKGGALLEPSQT